MSLGRLMAQCELPEHVSLGGVRYTNPPLDSEAAGLQEQRQLARPNTIWLSRPSVVTWAGACLLHPPHSSPAGTEIRAQPRPFSPGAAPAAEAHSALHPTLRVQNAPDGAKRGGQNAPDGAALGGQNAPDLQAMREHAAMTLRKIAAHYGAENADALPVDELYPRVDENGEVVLPKWLKWEDLGVMGGMADIDRDALALM